MSAQAKATQADFFERELWRLAAEAERSFSISAEQLDRCSWRLIAWKLRDAHDILSRARKRPPPPTGPERFL